MDQRIEELEREVSLLKKKLERSENSRKLIEQAKDQYDLVYRTSIMRLDQQKTLLNQAKGELIEKNKELESAQKIAEAANEAKGRFLANMSHEIRTPLNGILGFLELMDLTPLEPKQKNYLKEVKVASELLLFLINDILDFSKIEAGYLEIETQEFNLLDTINSALSIVTPRAEKKGIAIEKEIDPSLPTKVMGDSSRLLQVLNNILGNAVKFTDKGFVRLTAKVIRKREDRDEIEFKVEDSGIGLRGIKEEELFNAFSQADSSVTRRYGGTGLGLAISRELVQLMGGTITTMSGVSEGAIFVFTIPFSIATGEDPTSMNQNLMADLKSVDPMTILLAEDNPVNVRLVEIMLEQMGLQCEVVSNGKRALERCMESAFDLILMDGQMPEMDGYESSKLIRSLVNPSSGAYILAMTANAMAGDKIRCFDAGMDDYIAKPMQPKDFFAKIKCISDLLKQRKEQERMMVFTEEMLEEVADNLYLFEKEIGCDVGDLWDLARLFADDILPKMEELKHQLHQGDEESARRILHGMVGAAGNIRFNNLLTTMKEIHHHIINKEWREAEGLTSEMILYVNALKNALKKD